MYGALLTGAQAASNTFRFGRSLSAAHKRASAILLHRLLSTPCSRDCILTACMGLGYYLLSTAAAPAEAAALLAAFAFPEQATLPNYPLPPTTEYSKLVRLAAVRAALTCPPLTVALSSIALGSGSGSGAGALLPDCVLPALIAATENHRDASYHYLALQALATALQTCADAAAAQRTSSMIVLLLLCLIFGPQNSMHYSASILSLFPISYCLSYFTIRALA